MLKGLSGLFKSRFSCFHIIYFKTALEGVLFGSFMPVVLTIEPSSESPGRLVKPQIAGISDPADKEQV